jgi:hypothetical protein
MLQVARDMLKTICTKEHAMTHQAHTIDPAALCAVTGGTSRIDGLISDLSSLSSSIKEIETKTRGFDDTQMLLLLMLAMDRRGR